jgi:hypothetical protein
MRADKHVCAPWTLRYHGTADEGIRAGDHAGAWMPARANVRTAARNRIMRPSPALKAGKLRLSATPKRRMASLLDCGKTKSPRWGERRDELTQNAGAEQGIAHI